MKNMPRLPQAFRELGKRQQELQLPIFAVHGTADKTTSQQVCHACNSWQHGVRWHGERDALYMLLAEMRSPVVPASAGCKGFADELS